MRLTLPPQGEGVLLKRLIGRKHYLLYLKLNNKIIWNTV